MPRRALRIEALPDLGVLVLAAPQDPGRKEAVEQGLHEGRAKEMLALLAFEGNPERFLQSLAHPRETGGVRPARVVDPSQGVAGIGSEEPRDILRLRQRRAVQEHALDELLEPFGKLLGRPRRAGHLPEAGLIVGQREMLKARAPPELVAPDEEEAAQVGDQDEAELLPIARDLLGAGDDLDGLARALRLDHAAVGRQA